MLVVDPLLTDGVADAEHHAAAESDRRDFSGGALCPHRQLPGSRARDKHPVSTSTSTSAKPATYDFEVPLRGRYLCHAHEAPAGERGCRGLGERVDVFRQLMAVELAAEFDGFRCAPGQRSASVRDRTRLRWRRDSLPVCRQRWRRPTPSACSPHHSPLRARLASSRASSGCRPGRRYSAGTSRCCPR